MVVSQKTYPELDDVVPSWIEAVVANFFRLPIRSRFRRTATDHCTRRNGHQWDGKTLEFGVHPAWLHVSIQKIPCRFASTMTLADLNLALLVLDLLG